MYLADYHVHSTCSQDGRQTMAQAAQAAVAAGLDELCLTDHVDTIYWGPEQKPRWDFDWDAVRRQFRQAQEQWGHRITLRLGAELGEAAMSFQRAEHLMQDAPPLDRNFTTRTSTILKKLTKRIMIVSSTAIWRTCWRWPDGVSFRCWAI